MQREDESLKGVWQKFEANQDQEEKQFFKREGILYRRWAPVKEETWNEVEQLVLPAAG